MISAKQVALRALWKGCCEPHVCPHVWLHVSPENHTHPFLLPPHFHGRVTSGLFHWNEEGRGALGNVVPNLFSVR